MKLFSKFRTPESVQVATRFRPEYDPENPNSFDEIRLHNVFPQPDPAKYTCVATWIPPSLIIMALCPEFPRVSELRIQGLITEHACVLALSYAAQGTDIEHITSFHITLFETWVALAQDLRNVQRMSKGAEDDGSDHVDTDGGESNGDCFSYTRGQTKGRHWVINGFRRLVHTMIGTFALVIKLNIVTDTRRDSDQTLLTMRLFDQMLAD
eukprot:2019158-Rhodomonas_salina.1